MDVQERDHLFVSYAGEDAAFAEWLTLRLTAEGYKVWCDRFNLLGGESYPKDIDKAIKERTFRLLALLSRHSISKPNPLKERTLALNIGRERNEDFLIPLNVDGLAPTEMGWMLSDLSYIPFNRSWAQGFSQVLKKLQSVDAPRPLADGKQVVSHWFASRDSVSHEPERLWTNLLAVQELPPVLVRMSAAGMASSGVISTWPHYRESDTVVWGFEPPENTSLLGLVDTEEVVWKNPYSGSKIRLPDVVTNLVKRYLHGHCLRKGMLETIDGKHLYFPAGLLPGNRLTFTGYQGRKTWVLAVGERTFRVSATDREKTRYHLSPTFRPTLWKYDQPVLQIQMRVYLTDLMGTPLDARKAARRRKKICKTWWNDEWLGRLLGVVNWMAGGGDCVNLALTPACRIVLAATPIRLTAPVGIDEGSLAPPETEGELELADEEVDGAPGEAHLDDDTRDNGDG